MNSKSWPRLFLLLLSAVLASGILISRRIYSLGPGEELGVDAFYHVTMADGGPLFCVQRTFPHTDMSIWKGHFYDKELLFHIFLGGIRHWEHCLGRSPSPPFHSLSIALIILNIAVFCAIAYRIDPRYSFVWPLLLVTLSPSFANRLMMVRPHNFAIVILLVSAWLLPRVESKKDLWVPAFLSVLFVYSYSNPHFLLIPAAIWSLILACRQRKVAFPLAICGSVLISLFLAMLIHPQSPNTFIVWKVQCFDVVREILFHGTDIGISSELRAPDRTWLLYNSGVFLTLGINTAIAAMIIRRKKGLGAIRHQTLFLFICQAVFTAGVFFSSRFIEYAVPFSILASAALCRTSRELFASDLMFSRLLPAGITTLLAASFAAMPWSYGFSIPPSREFASYGAWARNNLPEGTLVANIGWGDFTRLFHSAPHCRYLFGLDPMFAYASNPAETLKLRAFHRGDYIICPDEMRQITGANFAFIGLSDESEKNRASAMIERLGYLPVYYGEDGCLFYIGPAMAPKRP